MEAVMLMAAKKEKKEKAEKAGKEGHEEPKKVHITPKARKAKREKITVSSGKRKRAIARVFIRDGKGTIRINGMMLATLPNKYHKQMIREVLDIAGPRAEKLDIDADVRGGGASGQVQAVRTAIASGLVEHFNDESLERALVEHGGRTIIVSDTRRVEPKKYRGPKARARYQKSYR
jgi:small subunit ribosomal protein S9